MKTNKKNALTKALEAIAVRFEAMDEYDHILYEEGADSAYEEYDYEYVLVEELNKHGFSVIEDKVEGSLYEMHDRYVEILESQPDCEDDALRVFMDCLSYEEQETTEGNAPKVTLAGTAQEDVSVKEGAPTATRAEQQPSVEQEKPKEESTVAQDTEPKVEQPTRDYMPIVLLHSDVQFAKGHVVNILKQYAADGSPINKEKLREELAKLAAVKNSPFSYTDLYVSALEMYGVRWDSNRMSMAMDSVLRSRGFAWEVQQVKDEDYPTFGLDQEEQAVRSAEAVDRKIDSLLDTLFNTLAKIGNFTGLSQLCGVFIDAMNANKDNSFETFKEMAKAGYGYMHRRIQVLKALGDKASCAHAEELVALVGQGKLNIFEATLGGIAALLRTFGDAFNRNFRVKITNKLVNTVLEKVKGFCNLVAKATEKVIQSIAMGVSVAVALMVKTATWVVQGVAWVVRGVISTIKHVASPKKQAKA